MLWRLAAALCATVFACSNVAHADLIEFGNGERDAWFDAASAGGATDVTTIGFTGYSDGTPLNDQYQHLGVTFTDGDSFIAGESFNLFPEDGWGVQGLNSIDVALDAPQHAIAVDFPGIIRFFFYRNNELIDFSSEFIGDGPGSFGGVISSIPFDSVEITATAGLIAIDDLHFAAVPAPATFVFLPGLILFSRARRRMRPGS